MWDWSTANTHPITRRKYESFPTIYRISFNREFVFGVNAKTKDDKVDAKLFNSITLRSIGPAVTGGRISDFAFNPTNPAHYFAATASGGLWLTKNGTTWQAVADDMPNYSYGDVTMDPNNINVIWAGTGENNAQRSWRTAMACINPWMAVKAGIMWVLRTLNTSVRF